MRQGEEGAVKLRIIEFEPIQLDAGGGAAAEVRPGETPRLEVDRNGDGQFEQSKEPGVMQEQTFDSVQVQFPSGLSLISVPVQPTNPDPAVVLNESPENIKLAKWDPLSGGYRFYSPGTSDRLVGTLMIWGRVLGEIKRRPSFFVYLYEN